MTVQDFIVIYNETFIYVEKEYGKEKVKDLWKTLSDEWCVHLKELAEEKGIEGAYEYWGGREGTLSREKADFSMKLENGEIRSRIKNCPSVGELRERNRDIYTSYCEHCEALYSPVLEKFGLKYEKEFEICESTNLPAGRCRAVIKES